MKFMAKLVKAMTSKIKTATFQHRLRQKLSPANADKQSTKLAKPDKSRVDARPLYEKVTIFSKIIMIIKKHP